MDKKEFERTPMRIDSNRVLGKGKLMDYNVSDITWKVILKTEVEARS